MNFPKNINSSQHLTDQQKKKLLAVYNTIHDKNAVFEALDALQLNEVGSDPHSYLYAIEVMIKACSINEVSKLTYLEGQMTLIIGALQNLHNFFTEVVADDFFTLIEIDRAMSDTDECGSCERAVNELFNRKRRYYIEKLKALEIQSVA